MLEKLKLAENALARMVDRPGGALAEDYQAARAVLADIRATINPQPEQGRGIGPVTHIEGVSDGNA